MFESCLLLTLAVGLLTAIATVFASPVCWTSIAYIHTYFTCVNFTSTTDFALINPNRVPFNAYLVLKDSTFDYLPSTAFSGTMISVLEFDNVSFSKYGDPAPNATNPFEALSHTLRMLVFNQQPKAITSWSLLHCLKRLESLRLDSIGSVNLTSDFNKLPITVTEILIENSYVEKVDQDWLSKLRLLKYVTVKRTNIKNITRTMLPRPAPRLRELDISGNELSSLPEDLTADMPVLQALDVSFNKITTFHESTLEPVKNNGGVVHMSGNPIKCDCNLAFLLTYPKSWNYYLCSGPTAFAAKSIQSLRRVELCRRSRRHV